MVALDYRKISQNCGGKFGIVENPPPEGLDVDTQLYTAEGVVLIVIQKREKRSSSSPSPYSALRELIISRVIC